MKLFNLHSHVEATGVDIQFDFYISRQHTVKQTTGDHRTVRGQVAADFVRASELGDATYPSTNWKYKSNKSESKSEHGYTLLLLR